MRSLFKPPSTCLQVLLVGNSECNGCFRQFTYHVQNCTLEWNGSERSIKGALTVCCNHHTTFPTRKGQLVSDLYVDMSATYNGWVSATYNGWGAAWRRVLKLPSHNTLCSHRNHRGWVPSYFQQHKNRSRQQFFEDIDLFCSTRSIRKGWQFLWRQRQAPELPQPCRW